MDIRHLRMIAEVAQSKSLTKASERLYLTQSALSHQLKEIENYFGTPLFIRQKKEMLLTREGEIVLMASKRILDEIECTTKQIKRIRDEGLGEIRVSTECYTSYPWLASFLMEFKGIHPKVDIKVIGEATRYAVHNLLENNIDIAILEDNKNKKLDYTQLFKDEFFIIVPPYHKWANLKYIDVEEIQDEPYIMYNIPWEESSICKLLFPKGQPKGVNKLMLTEAILEMVKAGVGFTVLPNWIVYPKIKSKELKAIRITRYGFKRTWYAGVLKNRLLPDYMQSFIKGIAKHMKHSNEATTFKLHERAA